VIPIPVDSGSGTGKCSPENWVTFRFRFPARLYKRRPERNGNPGFGGEESRSGGVEPTWLSRPCLVAGGRVPRPCDELRVRPGRPYEVGALRAATQPAPAGVARDPNREGVEHGPKVPHAEGGRRGHSVGNASATAIRCDRCRGTRWWRAVGSTSWTCAVCSPPAPIERLLERAEVRS